MCVILRSNIREGLRLGRDDLDRLQINILLAVSAILVADAVD
jgi:hypothetical protein